MGSIPSFLAVQLFYGKANSLWRTLVIVEFSGWCEIDDEDIVFVSIEDDSKISGVEYNQLSDADKESYVLEDVVATIRDSNDGDWVDISFTPSDE